MSTNHDVCAVANDSYPVSFPSSEINAQTGIHAITGFFIAVGVFYCLGRMIGNQRTRRDTLWFATVILLPHLSQIYRAMPQCLTTPVYSYAAGTFLWQLGVATISSTWTYHHVGSQNGIPESFFLKPMVFPSRTTHARLFPSKHSFSYSYLLVGIPIEWNGVVGSLLSAGEAVKKHAWFSVSADDYLARATHSSGLQGKLRDYLSSQGVSKDRFLHAYLVTAPRFLGFSFNPVSFWYLYDHAKTLSAMILEVNNTFDERRMYYMDCAANDCIAPTKTFSATWSKDFHVSPFNDRDGSYSLTAKDFAAVNGQLRLDNNIVLRDPGGKAKIVARVFSTEAGVDPSKMSAIARWTFLTKWWWVGFMTNPRILKEARMLWVKKLQVFYRPEVFRTSIGRQETAEERSLEPYFRAFLTSLVNDGDQCPSISYIPAAGPDRGCIVWLRRERGFGSPALIEALDVHVLTPSFYAELVRSASVRHVFDKCCFKPKVGEAMLHVSDHEVLKRSVEDSLTRMKNDGIPRPVSVPLIRHYIVSFLRKGCAAASVADNYTKGYDGTQKQVHSSDFDMFVSLGYPLDAYKAYLNIVVLLLLTDQIAFGYGWIMKFYRHLLRLLLFVQVFWVSLTFRTHDLESGGVLSLTFVALAFHVLRLF